MAKSTLIRWQYGDLSVSVQVEALWGPDMIDDALLKSRRQFIAGARQLGMTLNETDFDLTEVDTTSDG